MDGLEVLEKIKALDVLAVAKETIDDNSNFIAGLNVIQVEHGVRSDGSEILPSYAALTIELKGGRTGLAGVTDHVTLFDTGEFHSRFYTELDGEEIEYGSADEKSAKLEKKYSTAKGSIFGLTEASREELIESRLQGAWKNGVESVTGLNFD